MRFLIALLFVATTARAACVDGVCIPWMDAVGVVRVSLRIVPATPAGGSIALQSLADGRRWTFRMTPAEVAGLRTMILPAGSHVVTVELERHRPASRQLDVPPGETFDAGAIGLARVPVVEGEVRGPDGKPLAGARAALHPAGGAATTGASGRFAIDVDGHWPSEVVITRAGFGTRVVRLDRTEGDVKLPPVTLQRGAELRVRVTRGAETAPIEARLGILIDEQRPVWIATRTLAPGRSTLTFNDLDRQPYVLLLAGPEPLQRLVVPAVVNADRKSIDVNLPTRQITGAVTLGGEPLRDATVTLHRGEQWTSTVVTDAKGEFASRAWETPSLDAVVSGGGLPSSRMLRLPANTFRIDLPARELRGRAVDRDGRPVARALVALQGEQGEVHTTVRTHADAEGRFRFAALDAGRFTLQAKADGFLRIDPVEVELPEISGAVEQTITFDTAYPRAIEVVDSAGHPAAGAAIVCAVDGRIRATAVTASDGQVAIGTPVGASVLFVIPREGSLAVVRLLPAIDDAAPVQRIAVPPGDAKLDIAARTDADVPLSGVSLLMRFNGELFTPEIARELRLWHRSSLRTGEDGRATLTRIPRGFYEFWPYQTPEEAELLIASSVALEAPIALQVVEGENDVTVRFESRP